MNCGLCEAPVMLVHDFGHVALAGALVSGDSLAVERKYPLRVGFCPACLAMQIIDPVPAKDIFRDYRYRASVSEANRLHFENYARDVYYRYAPDRVLEIGCNDGVFANPMVAFGAEVIGVDPSETATAGCGGHVIHGYFDQAMADDIGKVDVVVANNVLAHLDDVNGVVAAIGSVLKDGGVLVTENHHLEALIGGCQYDDIYHEHRYYYSILALSRLFERHGMSVVSADRQAVRGGSLRCVIRKGSGYSSNSASIIRRSEERAGLHEQATYERFSGSITDHIARLQAEVWAAGKVAGYGASGRGCSLMQNARLPISFVVDDTPGKVGLFTPGQHVPVVSPDHIPNAEAFLVFAWSFMGEIGKKLAGKAVIVPFPDVSTMRAAA